MAMEFGDRLPSAVAIPVSSARRELLPACLVEVTGLLVAAEVVLFIRLTRPGKAQPLTNTCEVSALW